MAQIFIYQTRLSRNRIRIQKIKAGVRENSGRNHIVGKWNAVAVENLTGTKRAILVGWILTIRRDTRTTNRSGRIAVSCCEGIARKSSAKLLAKIIRAHLSWQYDCER